MSTAYVNVAPTDPIGYKQYYRIVFDVSGQLWLEGPTQKLNSLYDNMGDTGAITPLSDNPAVSGDTVMTVDVWSSVPTGQSLTIAEVVRRLDSLGGGLFNQSSVRSIQKLSGIGEVTSGAQARQDATDGANKQNDENSFSNKLGGFLSGFGDYATLGVIALVAYAVISVSAAIIRPGSVVSVARE